MKPGLLDLGTATEPLIRGNTLRRVVRLRERVLDTDGVTWIAGDYLDLTGYTARAQVRPKLGSSSLAAEIAVTIRPHATDPGSVELLLTSAQTWNFQPTTYAWDLALTAPDGDRSTVLAGSIVVADGVTEVEP